MKDSVRPDSEVQCSKVQDDNLPPKKKATVELATPKQENLVNCL